MFLSCLATNNLWKRKTTIQILYGKGLFYNYDNAYEVLKYYSSLDRRRPDLQEVYDVLHCFSP